MAYWKLNMKNYDCTAVSLYNNQSLIYFSIYCLLIEKLRAQGVAIRGLLLARTHMRARAHTHTHAHTHTGRLYKNPDAAPKHIRTFLPKARHNFPWHNSFSSHECVCSVCITPFLFQNILTGRISSMWMHQQLCTAARLLQRILKWCYLILKRL